MSQPTRIPTYFFLGIGGIGMSALARYLLAQDIQVLGYDRTKTELTTTLETEGAKIFYDEVVAIHALSDFSNEGIHVIYTPAISNQSKLFTYLTSNDFTLQKRAALLGEITRSGKCLAVAGTHGKTTTTAILTHILKEAKVGFTAFLGGILNDINSNFYSTGNEYFVVEADEFDRSFLQLHPHAAVITSMDADHLDMYGTKENFEQTFYDFANQVSDELWVEESLSISGKKLGFGKDSTASIQKLEVIDGSYVFDLVLEDRVYSNIQFSLPGRHNVFNALAALSLAISNFPEKAGEFVAALKSFSGVKRRFNYLLKTPNRIIIDDYAHHPTEINAAFQGAKEMHPNENLMVIFQPHLFSRTENFAEDFALSLAQFDEICLLEIYPARELPIEGVDASFLLQKIKEKNKKIISKESITASIAATSCRVVLMLGAGDIGDEAQKVKNYFISNAEVV